MKILLIGSTGQLGSELFSDITMSGHTLVAPPREYFDISNTSDTTTFNHLLNDYKPDIVINTAALDDTLYCENTPLEAFKINTIAVKNMAESLYNTLPNSRFITFSTNYVFNGKYSRPFGEFDEPMPLQIYGLSKLASEYAAISYGNSTIIRTSWMFGESKSKHNLKHNFVDNIINESLQTKSIEVGDDEVMSPTYAKDLSKAVVQFINHKFFTDKKYSYKLYDVYHLTNEGYCTRCQLTKEIFRILNITTKLIQVKRKGKTKNMRRPYFTALTNNHAKEMGIELPRWEDALSRYLSKYLTSK